jgi:hypothetical protein
MTSVLPAPSVLFFKTLNYALCHIILFLSLVNKPSWISMLSMHRALARLGELGEQGPTRRKAQRNLKLVARVPINRATRNPINRATRVARDPINRTTRVARDPINRTTRVARYPINRATRDARYPINRATRVARDPTIRATRVATIRATRVARVPTNLLRNER